MDFYIVLGVDRAATLNDIKRAYKRLARKYHPDINPGDRLAAQQFRQIAAAYETLSDPDRRRRYDTGGSAGTDAEPSTFGFEGFDFSISVSGASASTFGDLFADMFQPRDAAAGFGPQRGADLQLTVAVGFEEAIRGGDRQISVTRQEPCRLCHGTGVLKTAEKSCQQCHGAGMVKSVRGHMVF